MTCDDHQRVVQALVDGLNQIAPTGIRVEERYGNVGIWTPHQQWQGCTDFFSILAADPNDADSLETATYAVLAGVQTEIMCETTLLWPLNPTSTPWVEVTDDGTHLTGGYRAAGAESITVIDLDLSRNIPSEHVTRKLENSAGWLFILSGLIGFIGFVLAVLGHNQSGNRMMYGYVFVRSVNWIVAIICLTRLERGAFGKPAVRMRETLVPLLLVLPLDVLLIREIVNSVDLF